MTNIFKLVIVFFQTLWRKLGYFFALFTHFFNNILAAVAVKVQKVALFFWQFFNSEYWILQEYEQLKRKVLMKRNTLRALSDQKLSEHTMFFRAKYKTNPNLQHLLVDAYAVATEAIFRITGLTLHPVQILGAIVLHYGDVAEMKTGEGKTLTAILPAYLNALSGKKVFIVTVNEYLVKRDFADNGKIFQFLGISLGRTLNQMRREDKLWNYSKDIIYGTNSEFGFDYLRDNMLQLWEQKLQQNHYYVIIDEVDSVLIDEGRTPLIISGRPRNRAKLYKKTHTFVQQLKSTDFKIDHEVKRCFLIKSGIMKANQYFGIKSLFALENAELFHFVSNALQANYVLKNGIDYLVKDNRVILIDQFTGRVTPDRSLSEGLHQALEAKEHCYIREENSVLATITYQNFFRLFDKIAGMTGTAKSEEDEFTRLFNMQVLQIPTNQPVIRFDDEDRFFYDKKQKYLALIQHIQQLQNNQQPILIGTASVKTSEEFGSILKRFGFNFRILNAKHHEREAELIATAGHHGQITIATNMAGRGTDIKLDDVAKTAGGLAILAVERNESRRIDYQLQGRSGRQGEPGYSAFYLSLDDDLFLRFGNRYLKTTFSPFREEVLKSRLLSSTIAGYQKKLQMTNYDQRKHLLEHDNVISQQMRVVYRQRDLIIEAKDFNWYLKQILHHYFIIQWRKQLPNQLEVDYQQIEQFLTKLKVQIALPDSFIDIFTDEATFTQIETVDLLTEQTLQLYHKIQNQLLDRTIDYIPDWMYQLIDKKAVKSNFLLLQLKNLCLQTIDQYWTIHLDELFRLKASSFLASYAQKSPLQGFIEKASLLFDNLKEDIILQSTTEIFTTLNKNWHYLQDNRYKKKEQFIR